MCLLRILHNRNNGVSWVATHHSHRATIRAVGVGIDVFKPDALLLYALDVGRYGFAIHLLVGYGAAHTLEHYQHYIRAFGFED